MKLDRIFNSVRAHKILLTIVIDTILLFLSLSLAYLIRLGSIDEIAIRYINQIFVIALILVPFKILMFWIFNLYHISFRYISFEEVLSVIKASAITSPMIAFIALIFRDWVIFSGFPRSVIFIDFFLTVFFITGMRAFFRLYYSGPNSKKRKDILIVGAGSAGEQLVRDMVRSERSSFLPVGFIDDNPKKNIP